MINSGFEYLLYYSKFLKSFKTKIKIRFYCRGKICHSWPQTRPYTLRQASPASGLLTCWAGHFLGAVLGAPGCLAASLPPPTRWQQDHPPPPAASQKCHIRGVQNYPGWEPLFWAKDKPNVRSVQVPWPLTAMLTVSDLYPGKQQLQLDK